MITKIARQVESEEILSGLGRGGFRIENGLGGDANDAFDDFVGDGVRRGCWGWSDGWGRLRFCEDLLQDFLDRLVLEVEGDFCVRGDTGFLERGPVGDNVDAF